MQIMNKRNVNYINKKTKKFLDKFIGRTEEIGINGATDIIKSSRINVNLNILNTNKNKFNINEMMYEYNKINDQSLNELKTCKNDLSKEYPNIIKITKDEESENNKNKNNKNKYTNIHSIFNSKIREKINDVNKDNYKNNGRLYNPHNFKEYIKLMDKFKKNRFGALGPDLLSDDWRKRMQKMNKIKEFSNSASLKNISKIKNIKNQIKINNANGNSISNINIQKCISLSPNDMELQRKQNEMKNSKFYKIQKYGKGVMLNKIRLQLNEYKMKELENENEKISQIKEFENSLKFNKILNLSNDNNNNNYNFNYNNDNNIIKKQKEEQKVNKNNYLDNLLKLKASFINFT